MPPTVAQTAPAFADPAPEASAGFGLNCNVARRGEYEDRRILPPPLPPVAQDFVEELYLGKRLDRRALFQQLDDEWTRRVLLPLAPVVLEDWSGSLPAQPGKDFSPFYIKPFDAEPIDFARPIVPVMSWLDDAAGAVSARAGTLAAMLVLDKFVNAPTGGSAFGPAPGKRSSRPKSPDAPLKRASSAAPIIGREAFDAHSRRGSHASREVVVESDLK